MATEKKNKIRVLIVDDSAVIRSLLSRILSQDAEIEVVGTAPDPFAARTQLLEKKPDVMTLDVEMPKMDGITFLSKVMEHFPTRTIILSSLTVAGAPTAIRALDAGAMAVMAKPAMDVTRSMSQATEELLSKVKSVARSPLPSIKKTSVLARKVGPALDRTTHAICAIAASTGGTEALKEVIPMLPAGFPGTAVVIHMPPLFTKTFSESIQRLAPHLEVREARDGDRLVPGLVLFAPGNFHLEIHRSGAHYITKLHQQPPLHGVRPAADFLMKTVAQAAGANAMGVVLTGMGRDGADGLLTMRHAGAWTITQSEATCVVYGMPREADALNASCASVPLEQIAEHLVARVRKRNSEAA
jgi:two-component system chemotaxis response regulator CheB